ncbi:MAG: ATP-binding protein [Actinomycetota bacterium]|nr:ATP-binding protein [Actinomycetota bacterium]
MNGSTAPSSPDEVEALLHGKRETELLNAEEQDWIDFKQSPYVLKDARHKWELAKDVAALGNLASGGCIVIGVKTVKDEVDFEERASGITAFPCSMVDGDEYRKAIDAHVYPFLRGLRILRFQRDDGCLAIILVPPQGDDDVPFLLKRVVDESGAEIAAFAVPTRDGARTRWEPVGQIHRDLADGRHSRRTSPGGDAPTQPALLPEVTVETLLDQARTLEAYMEWNDHPTLMLAAWPSHKVERIPHFNDEDGIRGQFEDPQGIRDSGFGIGWRATATSDGGALVANDSHRVRRLSPDGSFSVAASADEEFLARTSSRNTTPRPLLVNQTVLIEFSFVFCKFVHDVLAPAVDGEWQLGLVVLGAHSRPWKLRLGPPSTHPWPNELRDPSDDEWVRTAHSSGDPGRDAYQLVARFYDLFGLGENQIPFATGNSIDPDQIRNIQRG